MEEELTREEVEQLATLLYKFQVILENQEIEVNGVKMYNIEEAKKIEEALDIFDNYCK